MVNIKTEQEIDLMRYAGKILKETLDIIESNIKVGITTKELDEIAEKYIRSKDCTPSFKGYNGFTGSICTSVNDIVVHGIPSDEKLNDGDIISIDIGVNYKGYNADAGWTYAVGNVSSDKLMLMEKTKEALYKGLAAVRPGNRVSDISRAIEEHATENNLGIVKELVGHGVGKELHEEPEIPNYVLGEGIVLEKGMTLAIEPMLNLGTGKVYMLDDGWSIITADNKPSAYYEHTVLITDDGYEILTGVDMNV